MKILFFLPSQTRCGPTNVAYNIIKYLKQNESHIEIHLAYLWEGDSPDVQFCNEFIDKEHFLGSPGLSSVLKLIKVLRETKPDVVHSHGLIPDIYCAILSLNRNNRHFISTVHCNIDEDYNTTYATKRFKKVFFPMIHKYSLSQLDKVVCVSENSRISVPKINADIIHNGTEKNIFLEKNTVKENNVHFVFVGRLVKRKNVSFIIEKFNSSKIPSNYILNIIGEGDEFEYLKGKANGNNNIIFRGHSSKPESFFNNKTILINPSESEGMPMSVIEALSCGIPCLLSDISAHAELNRVMGIGIELFDLNGFDFFDKLESIVNNSFYNKNKIKSQAEKYFSIMSMSKKYIDLYFRLVRGSK